MTTCQLTALRSCYCPLWVSPSRLAVDHRHETSRLPLAKRIYSAPYGRTDYMIVQVAFVQMGADRTLKPIRKKPPCKFTANLVYLVGRGFTGAETLDDVVGQNSLIRRVAPTIVWLIPCSYRLSPGHNESLSHTVDALSYLGPAYRIRAALNHHQQIFQFCLDCWYNPDIVADDALLL